MCSCVCSIGIVWLWVAQSDARLQGIRNYSDANPFNACALGSLAMPMPCTEDECFAGVNRKIYAAVFRADYFAKLLRTKRLQNLLGDAIWIA